MEIFGIEIKRSKSELKKEKSISQQRIDVPLSDDGSINVEGDGVSLFNVYQMDMSGTAGSEAALITKYRGMSQQSEIERAVEEIVNDAIVINETTDPVVVITEFLDVSDGIKDKIREEFQTILDLLHFRSSGYEIFKRWYVDGRLFFHIIVDKTSSSNGIDALDMLDATKVQKVREFKREKNAETGIEFIKKIDDYYLYDHGSKSGYISKDAIRLKKDSVLSCSSGLIDAEKKYTIGYLHKAIKPLNQLRMTEDAIVIYRISRAPERRVFYIDVGSMPKQKAEQYMTSLMRQYRGKTIYDASTGEMKDDRKHMHIMEDFWLPRRDNKGGTEITTLEGGKNLGEMKDVEYFEKKLYQSLSVPINRLDSKDKFALGETNEITREELQFARFITRLRNRFSNIFLGALRIQLILKNIVTEEEWLDIENKIRFDFLQDNFFEELKTADIMQSRLNLLDRVEMYKDVYFSAEYIKKQILKQTDEEIEAMLEEMVPLEDPMQADPMGSSDSEPIDTESPETPPAAAPPLNDKNPPGKKPTPKKTRTKIVADEAI